MDNLVFETNIVFYACIFNILITGGIVIIWYHCSKKIKDINSVSFIHFFLIVGSIGNFVRCLRYLDIDNPGTALMYLQISISYIFLYKIIKKAEEVQKKARGGIIKWMNRFL